MTAEKLNWCLLLTVEFCLGIRLGSLESVCQLPASYLWLTPRFDLLCMGACQCPTSSGSSPLQVMGEGLDVVNLEGGGTSFFFLRGEAAPDPVALFFQDVGELSGFYISN